MKKTVFFRKKDGDKKATFDAKSCAKAEPKKKMNFNNKKAQLKIQATLLKQKR